jgi:hypothetical protein
MNHAFLDAMSLVHLGVGLALRLFRIPLWLAALIAVVWEVVEHVLKARWPHMFMFPSQDSLANASGDVLCCLAGWLLAGAISGSRGRPRAPRTAR